MKNEEWRMENGEWRMENGEWGLLVLVYTGSWGLVGFRGRSWDGFVGSKQFGAVPGKA
jgi:hypothetical protein